MNPMKRKVTYLQLVKKNQEEIWKNSNELNRIEMIIDERRISRTKKASNDKGRTAHLMKSPDYKTAGF